MVLWFTGLLVYLLVVILSRNDEPNRLYSVYIAPPVLTFWPGCYTKCASNIECVSNVKPMSEWLKGGMDEKFKWLMVNRLLANSL